MGHWIAFGVAKYGVTQTNFASDRLFEARRLAVVAQLRKTRCDSFGFRIGPA